MSPSLHPTLCSVALAILATAAPVNASATERPFEFGSLTFADGRSRRAVEDYVAYLERDATANAGRLATIRKLASSDVTYCVTVTSELGDGVEGSISTDGERVFIRVDGRCGPGGARWSMNARLAHEFEHARQFENGEFAFLRDRQTGRWGSEAATYDLGDEIKAWEAQLAVASTDDLWTGQGCRRAPSVLQRFADARTPQARAQVLVSIGYTGRNAELDRNVVAASPRHQAGMLLRPPFAPNFFGRVHTPARGVTAAPVDDSTPSSS
jgi:hypothetical protein